MANTANTDKLKNAIKQSDKKEVTKGGQLDPYRRAEAYLSKLAPKIAEALPKANGMGVERLNRIALTTLKTNPKLLQCSTESLIGAVLQSAQLGLEPNLNGSCYFVPYKNTVSFQIGYKGLIDLVTRRGEVLTIVAKEVREGDIFHYEYGLNENLKHIPAPHEQRGDLKYFYAYAKLKNGGFAFDVMHISDIEQVRNEHSISYKFDSKGSIWVKHYDSMAKKTVIKRLIKYLPISVETQNAVAHDETVKKDITDEAQHIFNDTESEEMEIEILDAEETKQ
jgi:recombination protein RecT